MKKGKLGGLLLTLRLLKTMLTNKDTSKWPKIFILLAIVYLFIPIDIIPDFIPVIGLLDDLGVFTVTATVVVSLFKKFRKMTYAR